MKLASTKADLKHIEQLTWLRGIAAFFVIVSHTLRAVEVKYKPMDEVGNNYGMSLLDLGSFGVVLFFALSGCTLYLSNSDKIDLRNIANFYTKRFFRIWPAFVVSLIIYIVFGFIFAKWYVDPQGHWIEKQFLYSYSISDVVSYVTLTSNIVGPGGLFNNAYWSLPVEFQYYMIFPLIVTTLEFAGVIGPISLGVAVYLLPKLGFFKFDTDTVFNLAFTFCGGVLVGHIYKRTQFRINSIVGIAALVMLIVLSIGISHSYISLPDMPIISGKWNWYGGIAIAAVYIAIVTKINIHNRIESFLKHYGTISYSTYLYHNLFVATAVLLTIHFDIHDADSRLWLVFFFTLIASYIAATISYTYVENPFISLGRKIINKNC